MGGLSNKAAWSAHEVKQRLEAGEELSTLKQTLDAGGWRLSAVIHRLKKNGLPVLSYQRKGFGKVAFYKLVQCMHQVQQVDIFSCGAATSHTESTQQIGRAK